jgi:opacity protein-like surface antigen
VLVILCLNSKNSKMKLTIGRFPSSNVAYLLIISVCLLPNSQAIGDTNDTPSYYPPPAMQIHSEIRQPEATGMSAGIYGGAIAFQDGTLHITSTSFPGAEIKGNTRSELGGVAGLHFENTWVSFSAIGGDPAEAKPSVIMPAMGVDLFWTGYRYKASDATFGSGSSLQSDVNTFSVMYTPKLKFDVGAWRPYVGIGVGGTYVNAGNVQVNVPGVGSGALTGSGDDFDFSAEALAGFEVFVNPHWSLSFDYKYLYILDPTFHGNVGGFPIQYKINGLNNSLFTAGLNFYF